MNVMQTSSDMFTSQKVNNTSYNILNHHIPAMGGGWTYEYAGLYASFLKGQEHQGIFSLVKGTL